MLGLPGQYTCPGLSRVLWARAGWPLGGVWSPSSGVKVAEPSSVRPPGPSGSPGDQRLCELLTNVACTMSTCGSSWLDGRGGLREALGAAAEAGRSRTRTGYPMVGLLE